MRGAIVEALACELRSLSTSHKLGGAEIERLRDGVGRSTELLAGAGGRQQRAPLLRVVRRIDLAEDVVAIACELEDLDDLLAGVAFELRVPLPLGCVRRRKRKRTLITAKDTSEADPSTARLLARAFAARKVLLESASIDTAAVALGYSRDYVVAPARLSYLAPALVTAILDGASSGLTSKGPLTRTRLPLCWDEQSAMFALG